jgi:DNA repair exonuclease SbcCD nuclease subunit
MNIAIISDTHFGYAWSTERQEDSFFQAREAMEKALKKADFILLPGDVFDSRIPKQEVMEKAMRILSKALDAPNTGVKIVDSVNKDLSSIPYYTLEGVPVVAIHGTHERRGSNMTNPMEALEAAGLLVHLHLGTLVIEKKGERVAVHGMSGVPEAFAKESLEAWEPKPVKGACNIIVFHQSFKEMIYAETPMMEFSDLPPGFDLYVNGHIHWNSIQEKNGKKILHPGSTIITQMRKIEAEKPKGFYFFDSKTGQLEFNPLENQRKLFFKQLEFDGEKPSQVVSQANKILESIPKTSPKPLVKLKLKGSLKTGSSFSASDVGSSFKNDFLLSVDDELSTEDFKKKIDALRKMHEKKASVVEKGFDLLVENLKQADYDGIPPQKILSLLEEGESEKVLETLSENQD